MPRGRVPKRHPTTQDPVFGSQEVGAFCNTVMKHGKKNQAFKIIYGAFKHIQKTFLEENQLDERFQKIVDEQRELLGLSEGEVLPDDKIGLVVFHHSINTVRPHVKVQSNRVGGDTRQVPKALPIQEGRRRARNFIIEAAKARRTSTSFQPGDQGMGKLLALELIAAYKGTGGAVKKCSDTHRMAKANQAYVYPRFATNQETPLSN